MEKMLEKVTSIEEKIMLSIELLEFAKKYCESNFDKGNEIVSIGSLLGVILREQRDIVDSVDDII